MENCDGCIFLDNDIENNPYRGIFSPNSDSVLLKGIRLKPYIMELRQSGSQHNYFENEIINFKSKGITFNATFNCSILNNRAISMKTSPEWNVIGIQSWDSNGWNDDTTFSQNNRFLVVIILKLMLSKGGEIVLHDSKISSDTVKIRINAYGDGIKGFGSSISNCHIEVYDPDSWYSNNSNGINSDSYAGRRSLIKSNTILVSGWSRGIWAVESYRLQFH